MPPGLRLDAIAERVGQLPGHTKDGFLAVANSGVVRSKYQPADVTSLEGLTWPDTYFVADGQTDEQILQMIVSEFDAHMDALGLGAPNTTGLSPYQVLTMASLVQGEAGARPTRPTVAGVILNRLRRGMPLQIDATLCYAKGGCPPVPSNADKQIDSAYNTYRVTGLPPTPIATITEGAVRAVARARQPQLPLLRHRHRRRHPFRRDPRRPPGEHRQVRGARRMSAPDPEVSSGTWVRGSTTVAGVIGDPVRHSRSPAIHNAAFAAVGLDWLFCAFEVPRGGAARALDAMRALGLGGMSVTMPHKHDAAAACDDLTPEAHALASINTVVPRPGGRLLGASTDGAGLLGLLQDHDQDPATRTALVLGAGGSRARSRSPWPTPAPVSWSPLGAATRPNPPPGSTRRSTPPCSLSATPAPTTWW